MPLLAARWDGKVKSGSGYLRDAAGPAAVSQSETLYRSGQSAVVILRSTALFLLVYK